MVFVLFVSVGVVLTTTLRNTVCVSVKCSMCVHFYFLFSYIHEFQTDSRFSFIITLEAMTSILSVRLLSLKQSFVLSGWSSVNQARDGNLCCRSNLLWTRLFSEFQP